MKLIVFAVCLLTLFLYSCNKSEENNPRIVKTLEGHWKLDHYQDSLTVLSRTNSLVEDSYGFTFEKNGGFIENKNSGSCGTPPISYAVFEGTWKSVNDSLFEIQVSYWGGIMTYQMRIIGLKKDELSIYNIHHRFSCIQTNPKIRK